MPTIELGHLDWIILGAYLTTILVIGTLAARKIKASDSYFLGSRRFGAVTMIAQSFGTGTHAEMPVSLAGIVYSAGFSGLWFQWKNLFVTPFYWLLAPLYRRFRRTTMAEVVEDRYGPWMRLLYTCYALGFFTINMASMLKGAAKVIHQSVGGGISVNAVVLGMPCIFLGYSLAGGLIAAAWTELLQGLLILCLSFMLIPLGWEQVGGLEGIRLTLGHDKLAFMGTGGINPWFIAVLTLNGLVGIVAQPHLIAAVGTGRTELDCRKGQLYGNFIKRFCTLGWAIVGLMVATVVAKGSFGTHALADPEEAFGFACRHFLFPGGIGLLIACFLAANMAGCSNFVVSVGALATNGIYRKYLHRDGADRHYLLVGRISGFLVTIAAVIYALYFIDRVLYSFLLTETLSTFVGISVLGGIVWPRANRWGSLASLVTASTINFVSYFVTHQRFDAFTPPIFAVSLASGVVALVVVSLLTQPEPAAALEGFYRNLQAPTEDDTADCSIATTGSPLLIPNLMHLRRGARGQSIVKAYRADLSGFVVGWAMVLLLLGGTWWWLR